MMTDQAKTPPTCAPVTLVQGAYRPDDCIPYRRRVAPSIDTPARVDDDLSFHGHHAKRWTGRSATGARHATTGELLAMPQALYSALWMAAFFSARRSASLAMTGRRSQTAPTPSSSTSHICDVSDETADVATDAVTRLWDRIAKGAILSRPFSYVRQAARNNVAPGRSQHRIRERSGLTDDPCDHRMPTTDAHLTLEQLCAAIPAGRRARVQHLLAGTLSGKVRRDNGVRDLRIELGAIPPAARERASERA